MKQINSLDTHFLIKLLEKEVRLIRKKKLKFNDSINKASSEAIKINKELIYVLNLIKKLKNQ